MARYIPLLSKSYKAGGTFAHCPICNGVWVDDLPLYGSVLCPNCPGYAVIRGLTENDISGNFGIAGRVKRWHTETVNGQEIRVIDEMELDSVSLLPPTKGDL